ncbi:uncharacterized protein [Lolium perenne]|uniref:uncharacterized protein n=1 Tax=Lolium perenne TaxID=4522 RepID=UPI0021F65BB7|nr:uncharacterized protein LOC127329147 [Lolium perenne]
MTINDGLDSNWEYHQNNVAVGAMFPSKRHMQDAIVKWAMSTQRLLRTTVSSGKYLTMECHDINCPGRVHGYVPKYETTWRVSDFVAHTCELASIRNDHCNLSSNLIARLLYTEIVEGQAMGVRGIIKNVKKHHLYNISYGKAWRAKQRALEMRFGSFRDAYDAVVRLLRTLQERNPDTYINIQDLFLPEYPTYRVLHRVFFSFGVCIESFRHCRPVLCVDGTFLTGQYKGQILTAIEMDGNNQIVPLAFAFLESENTESWLWFFRQLKISIVKDTPNVCILHDRHAGILKAVKTLKEPGQEMPWIDIQRHWCMPPGGQFLHTIQEQEPYESLQEAVHPEPAVEVYFFVYQTPGVHEPTERWSLLHDTHGARYGVMTTNLAESYNFVLRGNRALPLTAIVEGIFMGTVKYYRERREKAQMHIVNNPDTLYCSNIMEYMHKKKEKARNLAVVPIGNVERRFEVRLPTDMFGCGNPQRTHDVKIEMAGRSLLNRDIARAHRAAKLEANPNSLSPMVTRGGNQNWQIHPGWVQRLKWVGLLPFARLVEDTRSEVIGFTIHTADE